MPAISNQKAFGKITTATISRFLLLSLALVSVGCREQLMHNLSEQQANRLMTRLDDNHIESKKTRQADGRWSVEVERAQLPEALREMQKLRLLRDSRAGVGEGSSVIASRDQQRFAFERALSTEIEQTLLSVDGVLEARVHLNLPQVDPLFGKSVPGVQGSGSVFIISEQKLAFSREEVAALVAGAAGMSASGISVLIEVDQATVVATPTSTSATALTPSPDEAAIPVARHETEAWRALLKQTKSVPLIGGVLLVLFGAYLARLIVGQSKSRNISAQNF